jgi:hypothetical protein
LEPPLKPVTFACLLAGASTLLAAALWLHLEPVQAATASIPLAPHRAVYDLTLVKSKGLKAPTSAKGRIAYDFSGSACEGYVANFRQLVELEPVEGPQRVTDMHSATFEDGDAKTFRFQIDTRVDGQQNEDIDGSVARAADGALSVRLQKPKIGNFDLDRDILFPTEHMMKILGAAHAGQTILQAKVFDGSETGEKVYDTLTVIGRPADDIASEEAAHNAALNGLSRWPVAISYFDRDKADDVPAYVMSFDLYENGIARALKIDYGDFVLAGEMTSLEVLTEQHPCQ